MTAAKEYVQGTQLNPQQKARIQLMTGDGVLCLACCWSALRWVLSQDLSDHAWIVHRRLFQHARRSVI